jgi:ribose transport system permease protein
LNNALRKIGLFLLDQKLLVILIILLAVLISADPYFFRPNRLMLVLEHITVNGIMAVGMTILLISGSFDLSIGSVMSLAGLVVIMLQPLGVAIAILGALLAGAAVGFMNGVIVAKGRINAFIATLGTMIAIKGFALGISRSSSLFGSNQAFNTIAQGKLFFVPNLVYFLILVFILGWFILNRTKFGRNAFAIGGNENSARLAGINVDLYKILYFIICALTASISGILLSSRINAASAVFGDNTPLIVISAVILGGTSLFGGKGKIVGTLQGVLILGLIEKLMVVLNILLYNQLLVRGFIILGVVLMDTLISGRPARKKTVTKTPVLKEDGV